MTSCHSGGYCSSVKLINLAPTQPTRNKNYICTLLVLNVMDKSLGVFSKCSNLHSFNTFFFFCDIIAALNRLRSFPEAFTSLTEDIKYSMLQRGIRGHFLQKPE